MSSEPGSGNGGEPAVAGGVPKAARWLAVLLDVTADGRIFLHLDRPNERGESHVFRSGSELGAFVAALLAAPAEPGDAALAALRDAARVIAARLPLGAADAG